MVNFAVADKSSITEVEKDILNGTAPIFNKTYFLNRVNQELVGLYEQHQKPFPLDQVQMRNQVAKDHSVNSLKIS